MMKNGIFAIMILALLTHTGTSHAKAREVRVEHSTPPITGLISDWNQFRAGIIARTHQFNKYSDIKPAQLRTLPRDLTGRWNAVNQHEHAGYQIHATLDLKKNHQFTYAYQIKARHSTQHWDFSGKWQEKNKILVLLIRKSHYPGKVRGDIMFWRLLQIGHSRLVYVRTSAHKMQAMRRVTGMRGS